MTNMEDPYIKLRPEAATPPEGLCHCATTAEICLVHKLSNNPIYCLDCNGEVPPEKLGLSAEVAEEVAYWNSVYRGLFALWLDSGEYESWAKERLLDPNGEVNEMGLSLLEDLGSVAKSYYYWFHDDEDEPLRSCPVCEEALMRKGETFQACEVCGILV